MIRSLILCAATFTITASHGSTEIPATTTSPVSKREILEFYPDWVPFKNKHGDELGEFVEVTKPKAKVKKRLALPMNFLIKAIAGDDSGDYFGAGETEGEDEQFDKKDWSDLNRLVYNDSERLHQPKRNLSDIEGVVDIITQETPRLVQILLSSQNSDRSKVRSREEDRSKVGSQEEDRAKDGSQEEDRSTDENQEKDIQMHWDKENHTESPDNYGTTLQDRTERKFAATPNPKVDLYNEDEDYSGELVQTTTQQSPEDEKLSTEEQKENEEKKKLILDSVDQLKLRHEQEQKAILEKNREDYYDNEQRNRNIQTKKKQKKPRVRTTPPNYDEYEDLSWKDKYNINVEKKIESSEEEEVPILIHHLEKGELTTTTTTTEKYVESERAKYSVFKNPSLYAIKDEDDEEEENKTRQRSPSSAPRRFSSKFNSAESNTKRTYSSSLASTTEKIEPILFFPKLKSKRKLKNSASSTTATDSYVAETVEDKLTNKLTTKPMQAYSSAETTEYYKTTAFDDSLPTTTISLWKEDTPAEAERGNKMNRNSFNVIRDKEGNLYHDVADTTQNNEDFTSPDPHTAPSGEAETNNSETVADAVPASSDHKKEGHKDYHEERGGGQEHHSSHEEEHEEHGKKAYEGLHKDSKTKKGHHDKEDHLGKYEDHGGHKKEHHDESGHYGDHHHEEHGKKHAKYEETGKHSKGHSTKGSHDIHKKEEYEKNVEFFEEEGDSAEEEKHGGFHNEKKHEAGGLFKRAKLHNDHHENKKGESGKYLKHGHYNIDKGHKHSGGHDSHGKRGTANHLAEGLRGGKTWVYHHGHPATNANLVVIDRRADRYMHGPIYYG